MIDKAPVDEVGSRLCRRADQAFNSIERKNSEVQWDNITKYILPSQSGQFMVNKTAKGEKRTIDIYDSTAIQSNKELAAAIGATVTNPAVRWSSLRFKSDELNNNNEAIAWLEKANKTMHMEINESNFYREASKNYRFYTALGNMVLLEEEKDLAPDASFGGFQFKAIHLSEIAWSENSEGVVDTAYRKFKLTARQAIEQFDSAKLSNKIIESYEKDPEKEFPFLHCIYPRPKLKQGKNTVPLMSGKERPFESVYLDYTSKQIVEEDGYYEFPVFIVRSETAPSEIYGFGPGHTAIPDVRTLNELIKQKLTSTEKAISPPLLVSSRANVGRMDQRAGGVTVVDGDLGNAVKELHTTARFDVAENEIENLKKSIRNIFYLDKLLLPERPEVKTEMTAYEISQRIEQMQRVMGPLLDPLLFEYLSPIVLRSFKALLRSGAFGQLPAVLKSGLDVEIVFINQLARSQRIDDVNTSQTWMNYVGMLAQMDPTALDNVNVDFLVTNGADILGTPKKSLRSDEEVAAIRANRAKMQQEQMQLDSQVKAADINAKNSKAGGGQNGGQ